MRGFGTGVRHLFQYKRRNRMLEDAGVLEHVPDPCSKPSIALYLALAFGLAWGMWIPAGIATGGYQVGINATPVMIALAAVGMFAPLLAALAAVRISGGCAKDQLALRPRIAQNLRTYLLAWFAPPVLALAGAVVFFLANPHLFDPTMPLLADALEQQGPAIPREALPALLAATIVQAVLVAPFINAIFAFGEEAGWRGLLYPALRERLSVRGALLASGVVWGLWHAPITAMGHNYGMGYAGFPATGILAMVVFCTVVGAFLAYLRERSGSVWPCALAHGAINATANIATLFCSAGATIAGPSPAGLIGVLSTIALALWCARKLNAGKES